METLSYEWMIAHAKDPSDRLTQAFAGAVDCSLHHPGKRPYVLSGMEAEFEAMMDRYFPGARQDAGMAAQEVSSAGCEALGGEEFGDLLDLLMAHRTRQDVESAWLAFAIATACMASDHLYQDMGLPNRQVLSGLMEDYFTSLFVRNVGNMKWKKFLYKQLCDQAEIRVCRAPSCGVCIDYQKCFGPEDGPAN